MEDDDLNIPLEKFQTLYGETVGLDVDFVEMRMLLDNLLEIEAITRKHHSKLCGKRYVQQKLVIIGVIPNSIPVKYLKESNRN